MRDLVDERDADLVVRMSVKDWNAYLKQRKLGKGPSLLSLDLDQRVVEAANPLKKVMSGGPFAAKLSVATKHLKAGYNGKIQQQPVPGLDGAFELDVASLGKLAAWLGELSKRLKRVEWPL